MAQDLAEAGGSTTDLMVVGRWRAPSHASDLRERRGGPPGFGSEILRETVNPSGEQHPAVPPIHATAGGAESRPAAPKRRAALWARTRPDSHRLSWPTVDNGGVWRRTACPFGSTAAIREMKGFGEPQGVHPWNLQR